MQERERTGPHRRVEKILDEMGVSYISEYMAFAPYKVDIYLPEFHAVIEIDGMGHSRRLDRDRDLYIENVYHAPTLRINATSTKLGQESMRVDTLRPTILDFIEKWATTAPKRIQRRRDEQQDASTKIGRE